MSSSPKSPYQPFLLRFLHSAIAFFVLAAIITAFWTYDTYDGRWGGLPLPKWSDIEGIHGTFGLWSLLIFPIFVFYAIHRGQRRLIQSSFVRELNKIGKPIWWYNLHRLTNTLAIFALSFALFSGKMMDEKWLPRGELNHGWYYAHLISWVVLVIAIALHSLMGLKVGGKPLLLSMFHWQFRSKDSPFLWGTQVKTWLKENKIATGIKQELRKLSPHLKIIEIVIFSSLIIAWILPLIK
ncbi:cytochrome b/b6 domain-containing protein [Dactylococcopsis salina]|uniref:Cytochrome b(N-terminal)/b6/petB n=1 Tax=Dactylococcopsis salina (strain PCC 8305) TaxID=13035 RepID=K9Z0C0_DACS8|nr:cytochrome b/b6 domain-containing protein [Dactylococcopsis salina]AFZ51813.1 Cytochrome b(N-terminal)/b6/petB [Dactylococcopsis salina PCC 8305]